MSSDDLKTRIAAARQKAGIDGTDTSQTASTTGHLGQGMRVGIEFVSAIGVSTFIGWMLDNWLGTLPLAMIVMFVVGAAAGFLNVYRLAQDQGGIAKQNPASTDDKPDT